MTLEDSISKGGPDAHCHAHERTADCGTEKA